MDCATDLSLIDDLRAASAHRPQPKLDLIALFMRFTRLGDSLGDLRQAPRGAASSEEQTRYHLANLRAIQTLAQADLRIS